MQFDKVLEVMRAKGVSQTQLAEYLGVSTGKVTDWKKGRLMSWKGYLQEIASFLGVTVDDLLGNQKRPATLTGDESVSEEEYQLIMRYRSASREIQAAVLKIVGE